MDWSRAKAALIVAFLILDAFLGVQVYGQITSPGSGLNRVTAADIRTVKTRLESAGVRLDCSLPRQSPPMPYLVLKPGIPKVREIQEKLQASEEVRGNSLSTLLDNGVLLYTHAIKPGSGRISRSQAVATAREFVEKYSDQSWGERFDYAVPSGAAWVVNFCSRFDDRPVFGSNITVKVYDSGVSEARFAWFEPLGYSTQRRSILPSTEAVLAAVSSMGVGAKGLSVIDVSLGYHSEPYDAKQWESVPVWRVLFGDGSTVYVNAHTGEVEKPSLVTR